MKIERNGARWRMRGAIIEIKGDKTTSTVAADVMKPSDDLPGFYHVTTIAGDEMYVNAGDIRTIRPTEAETGRGTNE